MRALVLSGGGPLAVAWQTGILAGLAERGVSLNHADVVVGTSAGALVGACLRLGRQPKTMAEAIISETAATAGEGIRYAAEAIAKLPSLFASAQSGGPDDGAAKRKPIGEYAANASTESETV